MNAAQACLGSLPTSPRSHRLQPVQPDVRAGCVPCSQLQLVQPARLYNSLPGHPPHCQRSSTVDSPLRLPGQKFATRRRTVGRSRTHACRSDGALPRAIGVATDNATYRTRRATTLAGSRAGADPGQGHDLPVGLQTGDGKPRDRGLAPAQQPGPDACLLQIESSSWAGRDLGRSSAGRTDDALAPCG